MFYNNFTISARDFSVRIAEYLPQLIGALVILFIGILIATILSLFVFLIFYLLGMLFKYNNYIVIKKFNLTIPKLLSVLAFLIIFGTSVLPLVVYKLGITM